MSNPALMESFPEVSISEGKDWWVIGTIEVLESETIRAGSWGRTSINTSDDGSTEHNVWGVSVVEGSGETSGIGNDTTSNNKDWLVSGNSIVLKINKNLLDSSDIFINLVTSVNELDALNLVGIEVVLEFLSIDLLDFVVDDGNTSSEWSVVVSEELVGWVKNVSGDLDGSCKGGAHDSLNGSGVLSGESATIAVSVDGGWVDGVWVDGLKSFIVGKILLGN